MDINKKIKEYIDKLSRAGKNLIPNWVVSKSYMISVNYSYMAIKFFYKFN